MNQVSIIKTQCTIWCTCWFGSHFSKLIFTFIEIAQHKIYTPHKCYKIPSQSEATATFHQLLILLIYILCIQTCYTIVATTQTHLHAHCKQNLLSKQQMLLYFDSLFRRSMSCQRIPMLLCYNSTVSNFHISFLIFRHLLLKKKRKYLVDHL